MQLRFDARAVIVTGAAQGIGRAIAQAFRDGGARVHVADLDEEGLRRTAEAIGATAHALDLSDRTAAHRLVEAVVAAEGRLDILALAAGGVRGQVGRGIEDISEADWRVLFQANVDGAFWVAQAAAPHMKRAGYGRIVTISSGAGLRPSLTGIQAYAAAKHALVGLTRQLSWELAPHGVTVNSVAPGFVRSKPATQRQWEQLRTRRPEAPGRLDPHQAPRHARGHRDRDAVLRERTGGLDHRAGAVGRWREVVTTPPPACGEGWSERGGRGPSPGRRRAPTRPLPFHGRGVTAARPGNKASHRRRAGRSSAPCPSYFGGGRRRR